LWQCQSSAIVTVSSVAHESKGPSVTCIKFPCRSLRVSLRRPAEPWADLQAGAPPRASTVAELRKRAAMTI
jgi:hypothetical protein